MRELPPRFTITAIPSLALLFFVLLFPVLPVAAGEDEQATRWLERLPPALNMTSYRGVFVYARGDQVHSMRIAHRYRDGIVEERLVLQDGSSAEIVRKGANVVCVLPETGRIRLDEVIPSGPFANVSSGQMIPVGNWYSATTVGDGRVAGYETVQIALKSKDQYRYSHRLWLEKKTGLLVKSQVRGSSGTIMEQFQFTSLDITDDIPDEEFEVRTEGREVSRHVDRAATSSPVPRMEGWSLDWRPRGFMPAAAPRARGGQAVAFSDGLVAFSVFVEPAGRLKMPKGVSRVGATTIFMHELESGGRKFLVTVVGEVPPATARKVAGSVRVGDTVALEEGG